MIQPGSRGGKLFAALPRDPDRGVAIMAKAAARGDPAAAQALFLLASATKRKPGKFDVYASAVKQRIDIRKLLLAA
ncbi:hypothetical protein ABTL39_19310, partial [Acinetobacter baumannii]